MVNRYKGTCIECGGFVPARGGNLTKNGRTWEVRHLACEDGPSVISIRTSGGDFIRNARGRCEDAPCCGCCTI